jgi:hypothetical protein
MFNNPFLINRAWFDFFNQSLSIIEGTQKTSSLLDSAPLLEKIYNIDIKKKNTSRWQSGEKVFLQLGYFDKIDATVGGGFSEFGDVSSINYYYWNSNCEHNRSLFLIYYLRSV